MADDPNYWNRHCKTEGCFGVARPLSDYCNECCNKLKDKKEVKEE